MADHVKRGKVVKNVFTEGESRSRMRQKVIMYFVYALWSERFDKIYVGFSNDPERRLKEHNQGKSTFTKKYRPWERFFLEQAANSVQARKKEKYYKSGWGRKRLKSILEEWQSGRMHQS